MYFYNAFLCHQELRVPGATIGVLSVMKRQKMNGTLLPSLISLTFWEINLPELRYIRVIGRDGTDTQYNMIMQKIVIIFSIVN